MELHSGSVLQPLSLKPTDEVCVLASPDTVRDCEPQCNIVSPVRRDEICLRDVASSEEASLDIRGSFPSFHTPQEEDHNMDAPFVVAGESMMAMIMTRTDVKEGLSWVAAILWSCVMKYGKCHAGFCCWHLNFPAAVLNLSLELLLSVAIDNGGSYGPCLGFVELSSWGYCLLEFFTIPCGCWSRMF
ncbi:hypothetical protein Nepgr_027257 [Nepenthes gracilis]|uniref:Uncharacterized protein n=1 Tax=Nepenthes gracilis TaxID=150966 RepID=A0AAD3TAH4_NEPGR|nr:hypothetical protein Nepgr_027257 [Nepenthes gracilis]